MQLCQQRPVSGSRRLIPLRSRRAITDRQLAAGTIGPIRIAAMDRCDMMYRNIARVHAERDFGVGCQIRRFNQLHAEAHHA